MGGDFARRGGETDVEFDDFMAAFRKELVTSKETHGKLGKFVPSTKVVRRDEAEDFADAIFGGGGGGGGGRGFGGGLGDDDDDGYNEWPDELMSLGISAQNAAQAETDSTTSSTEHSTTTDTDDSDVWPDEMMF